MWKAVAEPQEMPGFLAYRGEEFNPGPETRLDTQSFSVVKIHLSIREIEKASDTDIRRGMESDPSLVCSSVQSVSHIRLFATPWTAACQASLSITNPWSLLKLMAIDSVMSSKHLILCCPIFLLPLSFPVSGSFQMSQLFASGGQSIAVSASASFLPMNV